MNIKKSRIRETPNLLTDADSSTDIFVTAGVKKGADRIFFFCQKMFRLPMPRCSPMPVVMMYILVCNFFFRVLMPRCSPMPVVIMYIFVCTFFQGTDAMVLPKASCNYVHFCLYTFSGYQCHGAPLGLQKSHGKGTDTQTHRRTSQLLD